MTTSAQSRLSVEQRRQLENLAASFRMELMEPTEAELELGARYLLDEISFEDLQAQLADLA